MMHNEKIVLLSPAAIALAEQLLAQTFHGPIKLAQGQNLGGSSRSLVCRYHLTQAPASAPATIIVKQFVSAEHTTFDPNSAAAHSFFNDWVALQFLSLNMPEYTFAPRFYAGEPNSGLFIMEDIGTGQRLDHILMANNPIHAEQALLEYATIHGQMHALAMSKYTEYLSIREPFGSPFSMASYVTHEKLSTQLQELCSALKIKYAEEVDHELQQLVHNLTHPGPFHTFIQGDTCLDNVIHTNSHLSMVDFEGSCFAHALLEGAYIILPFPTCRYVYRLPEPITLAMLQTYRTELSKACPAATNDMLFQQGLVEACIFWALNFGSFVPIAHLLQSDRHIIALSDRQRYLLYYANVARLTEKGSYLPALSAAFQEIAVRLQEMWVGTKEPEYYPAFAPTSHK